MESRDYSRTSKKRMQKWVENYKKKLDHKRRVMAKHKPGTAHHTRALREASFYESKIKEVEEAIRNSEID